jgi:luciferase family oxidoreductase group 1
MHLPRVPLSVLELATIGEGSSAQEALQATLRLARLAEELGFVRFWLAEHHNMPGIASSSPAVLAAAVGAATRQIRIGSGGVMLPNHPPLVVAEQFGTLEALYPGRVDLGIGRAPGTDLLTAQALRRGQTSEDFPRQLAEVMGFLHGGFAAGHPYAQMSAVPSNDTGPALWLLGSSGYSAQVAGMLGLPFAFAHHFSAENTLPALQLYRSTFRPSDVLQQPYAMVAVQVLCASSDEEAQRLSLPAALSFSRLRQGRPSRIPTVEEAQRHPWTEGELEIAAARAAGQAIGGPETVRRRLSELLQQTRADELMITTIVHDPQDRLASLQRVHELFA